MREKQTESANWQTLTPPTLMAGLVTSSPTKTRIKTLKLLFSYLSGNSKITECIFNSNLETYKTKTKPRNHKQLNCSFTYNLWAREDVQNCTVEGFEQPPCDFHNGF